MLKLKSLGVVVAVAMAMPLGVSEMAFAATKKKPENPKRRMTANSWSICRC